MAAGVGRRMQDLLHGVMGLIGMGHLQVREGDRKPKKEEDEREKLRVKKEGRVHEERQVKRNEHWHE